MVWKGEMYLKQDRNITYIIIPNYIKFKEQKWIKDSVHAAIINEKTYKTNIDK